MSNNDHDKNHERDARPENLAAELATTVYPMLLRRGLNESWLKTELIVWKRLTRTIKRWIRDRPPRTPPHELDALRERLFAGDSEGLARSFAKTD
jgi:hypothetical protein